MIYKIIFYVYIKNYLNYFYNLTIRKKNKMYLFVDNYLITMLNKIILNTWKTRYIMISCVYLTADIKNNIIIFRLLNLFIAFIDLQQ